MATRALLPVNRYLLSSPASLFFSSFSDDVFFGEHVWATEQVQAAGRDDGDDGDDALLQRALQSAVRARERAVEAVDQDAAGRDAVAGPGRDVAGGTVGGAGPVRASAPADMPPPLPVARANSDWGYASAAAPPYGSMTGIDEGNQP